VPVVWADQSTQTTTYTMTLKVGPAEPMYMSGAPAGTTAGEIMMPMAGMAMGPMSPTDMDQGQQVNHHLEVQILTTATRAVAVNLTPRIRVSSEAMPTGQARTLDAVAPMYGVTEGPGDLHYGQNLYLADDTYTVTVAVGNETATFQHVVVQAVGGASPTSIPMGTPSMGSAETKAMDGRSLSGEPQATQTMFMAVWGRQAAPEWVKEHSAAVMAMH